MDLAGVLKYSSGADTDEALAARKQELTIWQEEYCELMRIEIIKPEPKTSDFWDRAEKGEFKIKRIK